MRFEVLGPVRVVHAGQVRGPISTLRRRLLAVLLARANRPVSMEALSAALWADDAPKRPANSLHIHVHRLRQVLDHPDRLCGVPNGYVLEVGPDELDASLFESRHEEARQAVRDGDLDRAVEGFRSALALWREEAYADIDECRIVALEVRRLGEARMIAREELYDAELARGRAREIVPELTELVAAFPLREKLTGQLMLALHRSGRQTRALTAYRTLGRRLSRDLGTGPGPELRDLYERIRAEDPDLRHHDDAAVGKGKVKRAPTVGNAPAQAPAPLRPGQLPPAPGAFVGRDRELADLEQVLADDDGGVVVITGMAGVGKTGLAIRYAHQIAERFGDGQLYLDLRGHAPGPALEPTEALGILMRGLGARPSRAWETVAEASAEYRSLLTGRKMLVLLDNAATAEQVRPLLPATPGCLTLVTSRNRLSGLVAREGARRIGVGVLPAGDAEGLLARLLGARRLAAEPAEVAALIEACAGLPLALRIAAAQLADEPHRSIGAYLTELRAHGLVALALDDDDHSAVGRAFELSYQRLEAEERRLFRLLGLVPGLDFTAGAAAALAHTSEANARFMIRRLLGAHLLEEPESGRYRFHDLLRDYAAQRAGDEEPEEARCTALDRLFAWYYQGKQAACTVLVARRREPPPPVLPDGLPSVEPADIEEAIGWLRAEFLNLIAATRAAVECGSSHWVWHLGLGIAHDMAYRGFLADSLALSRRVVDAARTTDDPVPLAYALAELCALQGLAGEQIPDDGLATAIGLAENSGDRHAKAYCLYLAGVTSHRQGDLTAAVDLLTRALRVYREIGDDPGGLGYTLLHLGNVAFLGGDVRLAERRWSEMLELADEVNSATLTALLNLIEARVVLGMLDGLEALLDRAERVVADQADGVRALILACTRASWLAEQGRIGEALRRAEDAVRLADEVSIPRMRCETGLALGSCLLRAGQWERARAPIESAVETSRPPTQLPEYYARALRWLAELEFAVGDLAAAEARAREAMDSAPEWDRMTRGDALLVRARVAVASGRPSTALEHGEQALAIHGQTGFFLGLARAHEVLGEACHAVGTDEATRKGTEHLREALRMFETYGSPEAVEVERLLRH